ncbi:SDR family NAD(P)-dependent oxidoreductase [uncultured Microscilla sp.]|uniref:SDR family NAD(P)-dependent oxidoreductase n=1 Tax=uncultured Microscilla sp. TaxID=432653 RepID=UPI0026081B92|nr:SDR family oxidoreductase [uncultured Microscilla sp.]
MKNYLIIGGSSGIGKALVAQLASEGHQVYATYHTTAVSDAPKGVQYHPLNVTDETLNLDFLPDSIDGVAYCPGSINLLPFARIKPQQFANDYELQVLGAVKVLQAIQKKLKAAQNPSIVFFSTVAVQTGFAFHAQVAASKGAIEGLTRALAAEFAPSIRVNAIAPSITDTPLAGRLLNSDDKKDKNAQRHPLKKIGTPDDIAQTAAFLFSDKANWMTGQIIHVDGGMSSVKL